MSETASQSAHWEPARRAQPNWGVFLLVSLVIGISVGVLVEVLAMATGFRLPDAPVNIAIAIASLLIAGRLWLKKNNYRWDRDDRHRLAFAYTMVTLVVTLVVLAIAGLVIAFGDPAQFGLDVGALDAAGWGITAAIIALLVALMMWANYGINRLVLYHGLKRLARSHDDISKEFA